MAVPNRRIGRPRVTLVILILTSITLLTLDFRDFGPLERIQDSARTVINPIRSAASSAFAPFTSGWERLTDYDELERENQQLQAELETLRSRSVMSAYALEINEELAAELGLENTIPGQLAQVVGGPIGNFDPYVLEIDQGSAAGIRVDMPVLSNGALVGRIEEVGSNRSRVRLITDPEFRVGVQLVGGDELAIVSGGGEDEPLEVNQGFDAKTDVEVGDALVTSGVRGSAYPPGIPIGTVIDIEVDSGVLEKRLEIEPAANPDNPHIVNVWLYDPSTITDLESDPLVPEEDGEPSGEDGG